MIIVGLTGSIAMGKSTVSRMFEACGWPVFDSDAAVHEFYRSEGAKRVEAAFPGVLVGGEIDRKRLGAHVLNDDAAIKRLEAIVHPEVGLRRVAFRERAEAERRRGAVFDVPLLFETGGERNVQVVAVVSASAASQRARALQRPGMTAEKFEAILKRQTPDAEKRRRAHWVIDTEASLADTQKQVQDFVRALIGAPGERMMREIVLDTETTGLEAEKGDRIVEIACVEIVNDAPTGKTYHVLINPERDVPEEAARVHGHTSESLKDKPMFAAIAPDFLAFIGDDRLVIHNAEFDVRFLNAELGRLGHGPLAKERVVDTLAIARKKHPGASNSLDALCDRYRIDRSRRVFHGALLDCELLVEVYIELSGGRQKSLSLAAPTRAAAGHAAIERRAARPQPLAPRLTEADLAAHRQHMENYGDAAYWRKYGYAKAAEAAGKT